MASQNLADLRTRVKDWSNRRDLSDDLLTDVINVAQARLNRLLRLPVLESESTITILDGNNVLLPRDYLEAIQLKVVSGDRVINLERKDIQEVEELASKSTGTPCYFGRRGPNLVLAPTPANITEATLYYYIALQPLVLDGDTNWFVVDLPEALLYGALTEISLYLRDEIGAAQWEAKFQAAAREAQRMADEAQWSGGPLAISL